MGVAPAAHSEGRASAPIRVYEIPGYTPRQGVGVPPVGRNFTPDYTPPQGVGCVTPSAAVYSGAHRSAMAPRASRTACHEVHVGVPAQWVGLPATPFGGRGPSPFGCFGSPGDTLRQGSGSPRRLRGGPRRDRPQVGQDARKLAALPGPAALVAQRWTILPFKIMSLHTGRLWRPAPAEPHTVKSMLPAHGGPRSVGHAPGCTLRGSGPFLLFRVFCERTQ